MEDLFSSKNPLDRPLADRMRARNLDEYVGQDHLVGRGRLLRRCIAADRLSSAIFYGPPGVGKTTLARVIASHTKSAFITLNAVLTGVSDIRAAIKDAQEYYSLYSRRTILFVDEVHRWSKSQQDALLPFVENGTIILIGATTENPFFEVNRALVSRSRIFALTPLTNDDLHKIADMAIHDIDRGYGHYNVQFEKGALEHLIDSSAGDARNLLNALELAVVTTPPKWDPAANPPCPAYMSTIYITKEAAEQSIQKKVVLYDKDGDYHYDIISAFIKSLRGRDVDAALYYLARMVAAGEDPHFIFRRMLISSCEDTGLGDPNAIGIVQSCADAFDRVGLPEGRYFLAHAAIYLATCPKSNSSMAFFDALKLIETTESVDSDATNAEIPNHLKDGSRDAKGLGHGAGYQYPHSYRDHWVAQQYLPKELVGKVFYTPSTQGYEAKIHDEVIARREVQTAAILQSMGDANSAQDTRDATTQWWGAFESNGRPDSLDSNTITNGYENLTFSPPDAKKDSALAKADKKWQSRIDENKAQVLLNERDAIISRSRLLRHHRVLIWDADDGLILWEACRKTPEGSVCAVCRSSRSIEILNQCAAGLDVMDRPMFLLRTKAANSKFLTRDEFNDVLIEAEYKGFTADRVIFTNPFTNEESIKALSSAIKYVTTATKRVGLKFLDDGTPREKIKALTGGDFLVIIWQRIPRHTQHIARLIEEQILDPATIPKYIDIIDKLDAAETNFFSDTGNELFAWDEDFIEKAFSADGFKIEKTIIDTSEKRRVTKADIATWFSANSRYGSAMYKECGRELQKLVDLLEYSCDKKIFLWHTTSALFSITV